MPRFAIFFTCFSLLAAAAQANCLDRPLLIGRYHFPNPGAITPNWQDIYRWTPGASAIRLSTGAFPATERDHGSFAALPGGALLFQHSAAGGTDIRMDWMTALDADGDMSGDGRVTLSSGPFDIGGTAHRGGKVLATLLDANGDTQVGMASLTGTVLSPFAMLTADSTFPDTYAFLTDDLAIYDADGDGLRFVDLMTGTVTPAMVPQQFAREPSAPAQGDKVVFSALSGGTLDLFIADVLPGPSLSTPQPLIVTADRTEGSPAFSPDGQCLAWVSTPNVDSTGNPVQGPYADLFVRDMVTGTVTRLTYSRDLADVAWLVE